MMKFRTALSRAFKLQCPECGKANIADGWLSTTPRCSACDADLTVESGYFLGAIYFNYGTTILVVLSAAIPLVFVAKLPALPVAAVAAMFCIAFPLWFFRYARSLWLAMDHYYHVRRRDSAERQTATQPPALNPPPDATTNIGCICPLCHSRFRVDASLAHTWGKCRSCYGDVLLVPAFKLAPDKKAKPDREADAQVHYQFSP